MEAPEPLERVKGLAPYVPGLSIDEISERYGLAQVIKLASNENPLGVSPLARDAIAKTASRAFRYPQGGNPRLAGALARLHEVSPGRIAIGNGSDEIIDLLIRMFAESDRHSIACFNPCFSIYPIQAEINGNPVLRQPLKPDFSFDFDGLLERIVPETRLVFLTTPDNPSGYCPSREDVERFARSMREKNPLALLVIDEAYMDFATDERAKSLLASHIFPENVVFLRTFSKSYGLAGVRLGYAVLPERLAGFFWRTRLPFSVSLLAEEAGLAALEDHAFRKATLETVRQERDRVSAGLKALGCEVWPSEANFLMFAPPAGALDAATIYQRLLERGIIIRPLKSYGLPGHLRVSVGNGRENGVFLEALAKILGGGA